MKYYAVSTMIHTGGPVKYCLWQMQFALLISAFVVSCASGPTKRFEVPPCLGATLPSKVDRIVHYKIETSLPQYAIETNKEGQKIHPEQTQSPETCVLAFHLPEVRLFHSVFFNLNHAHISYYDRIMVPPQNFNIKLVFFHEISESHRKVIAEITIGNETVEEWGMGFHAHKLFRGIRTLYMAVSYGETRKVPCMLHFSVTLAPLYWCERSLQFSSVGLNCTKVKGYFHCNTSEGNICIRKIHFCNGNKLCRIQTISLKASEEGRMYAEKRSRVEMAFGIVAAVLVLTFALAVLFTIPGCNRFTRRICCPFIPQALPPQRRIPTEGLPSAPPPYDVLDRISRNRKNRCPLFYQDEPLSEYYEPPPSYAADSRDQTGVHPALLSALHPDRRYHSAPESRCARLKCFRSYTMPAVDSPTEDYLSTLSWSVANLRPLTAETSTELPSYRNFSSRETY